MTERRILPSHLGFAAGVALLGVASLLAMTGAVPPLAALITHLVGLPLVMAYAFFIRRHHDAEAVAADATQQTEKRYVALLGVIGLMTLLELFRSTGFNTRAAWSLLAAAALMGGFWLGFWIRGDA